MLSTTFSSFPIWIQDSLIPWLLDHGIKIVLILFISWIIIKISHTVIEKSVRRAVVGSHYATPLAEKKREDTLIQIFQGLLSVVLWIVVVMMILSELGISIGPLLAGAGIVGVALGFGAQYLVRDIINGLFIILENQFRVGDVVCFGTTCGTVERVTLRTTILRDLDGVVHYMPNGEIKHTANQTQDFSRINLNIGVGYNDDLDKVISVVNATGNELAQDPDWKDKIRTAPQFLRVDNFSASSVDIKILGEVRPLEQWAVAGELRKRLKIAFDKEGIEIPFPQSVIHYMPDQKEK